MYWTGFCFDLQKFLKVLVVEQLLDPQLYLTVIKQLELNSNFYFQQVACVLREELVFQSFPNINVICAIKQGVYVRISTLHVKWCHLHCDRSISNYLKIKNAFSWRLNSKIALSTFFPWDILLICGLISEIEDTVEKRTKYMRKPGWLVWITLITFLFSDKIYTRIQENGVDITITMYELKLQ